MSGVYVGAEVWVDPSWLAHAGYDDTFAMKPHVVVDVFADQVALRDFDAWVPVHVVKSAEVPS